MNFENGTILCRRCQVLALANLEGVPLCPSCLVKALKSSQDPYLVSKIKPLQLARGNVVKTFPAKRNVAALNEKRPAAKGALYEK